MYNKAHDRIDIARRGRISNVGRNYSFIPENGFKFSKSLEDLKFETSTVEGTSSHVKFLKNRNVFSLQNIFNLIKSERKGQS